MSPASPNAEIATEKQFRVAGGDPIDLDVDRQCLSKRSELTPGAMQRCAAGMKYPRTFLLRLLDGGSPSESVQIIEMQRN